MSPTEETELCFPQLPNASCRVAVRPHPLSLLASAALSCVSLLTVTLNLLVIVSISHFKQLHTPTCLLLLSLAVSDLFVGVLMLFQAMLVDGCWLLGDLACALYYLAACIVTSASIGNMVLISMDRYVAVCDPLRYPSKVTQARVQACVCVLWTCSAAVGVLGLDLQHPGRYGACLGQCAFVIDYVNGRLDLLLSFVAPVAVIVVLYVRVFAVAVSQARAARSHLAAVARVHSGAAAAAQRSELKAARTLGVVVAAFLICLCPYFSVTLTGQDTLLSTSSAAFAIWLFSFNSCLNPVIYAFFYPWFRKSVRLIVTLRILQPGSGEARVSCGVEPQA